MDTFIVASLFVLLLIPLSFTPLFNIIANEAIAQNITSPWADVYVESGYTLITTSQEQPTHRVPTEPTTPNPKGNNSAAGSTTITVEDRRHQLLTELSVIDSTELNVIDSMDTLVAAANETGNSMGLVREQAPASAISAATPDMPTSNGIEDFIGSLTPLRYDASIKAGVEDAIQALNSGDINKALLDLNEAHNVISKQLASSTVLTSNSTLRSSSSLNNATADTSSDQSTIG